MENVIMYTGTERYDNLQQLFVGTELTSQEQKTLLWLSEWSDETVNNLMSAIEKRLRNEQDKKKNSSETNVIILK